MTVSPFTLKYKFILNSGLSKIADLLANLETLPVTKFELGSDVNYEPALDQIAVHNLVFSDTNPLASGNFILNTLRISDTKVQIDFLVNNNIGDFQIGEIILKFSDGTPFLIGVLDNVFSKLKDPGGNAFQVSISVNLVNSDVVEITSDLTIFNSLNVVDTEDDLPLLTAYSTNMFIVNNYNSTGAWALAYKNLIDTEWKFISNVQGIYNENEILLASADGNVKSSGKNFSSTPDYNTAAELPKIPDKQSIVNYLATAYLPLSGGVVTGQITRNVAYLDPVLQGDLVTKDYVDYKSSAYKNKIINGDFRFWQRNTSFSITAVSAQYICDRWINNSAGTGGTRTISRQAFTAGELEGSGLSSPYYLRLNQSVAQSPQTLNQLMQKIEDIRTLAGRNVTLSFYAKASTPVVLTTNAAQNTGSGGTGTPIPITGQAHNITTTWTRFSYSFQFGSLTGLTLGANSYSAISFDLPLGSVVILDLAYIQLELGTKASYFDFRPYQAELELCQRYYEKSYNIDVVPNTITRSNSSIVITNAAGIGTYFKSEYFKVTKRTSPSILFFNPDVAGDVQARDTTGSLNCSATAIGNAGEGGFSWTTTSAGGSVIRAALQVNWTADAEI
jgi:hypothetical protein